MTHGGAVSAHEAEALLDEVESALARDLPALRRELGELLSLYDGIPTAIDVFEVLNLRGDEDRHTAFLAWLLDPAGSHGVGDQVLRRFLHLIDDPAVEPLHDSPGPLVAWVRPWLELPGAGIPDLVLVVEDVRRRAVALVVEAKIGAPLTYAPSGEPQTIRYMRAVSAPADLEAFVLQPCRRASRLSADGCTPVFVFLRADPGQEPDPDGALKEWPRQWRNVEYPSVERMLARFVQETDVATNVKALIQQFRTSLLAEALPEASSLAALRRLRTLRMRRSHAPDYLKAQELRGRLTGFRGVHEDV